MSEYKNNSTTTSAGIGFTGVLTVAFIVLKLTHVIDWSWWWVLSPVWIMAIISVIFIAVYFYIIWRLSK